MYERRLYHTFSAWGLPSIRGHCVSNLLELERELLRELEVEDDSGGVSCWRPKFSRWSPLVNTVLWPFVTICGGFDFTLGIIEERVGMTFPKSLPASGRLRRMVIFLCLIQGVVARHWQDLWRDLYMRRHTLYECCRGACPALLHWHLHFFSFKVSKGLPLPYAESEDLQIIFQVGALNMFNYLRADDKHK